MKVTKQNIIAAIISVGLVFSLSASASRIIFVLDLTGEICGEPGYCWVEDSNKNAEPEQTQGAEG